MTCLCIGHWFAFCCGLQVSPYVSTLPLCIVRPKIAAIISSQAPVLDRDHPHIMEEARYWCHIQTKRVCRQRSRLELNATSRVRADGAAINGLLSEARGQAPNGQPMQLQQAMEMLKAQSAPNGDNAGGQPSTKAKPQPKRKTKNPPMPLNPKSWKNIIADGCSLPSISLVYFWCFPGCVVGVQN